MGFSWFYWLFFIRETNYFQFGPPPGPDCRPPHHNSTRERERVTYGTVYDCVATWRVLRTRERTHTLKKIEVWWWCVEKNIKVSHERRSLRLSPGGTREINFDRRAGIRAEVKYQTLISILPITDNTSRSENLQGNPVQHALSFAALFSHEFFTKRLDSHRMNMDHAGTELEALNPLAINNGR